MTLRKTAPERVANEAKVSVRLERTADIILAAGAAVCVSVLLYFFYYYNWAQVRQFTSPVGMALYYVLPAGLAILLIAALRLRSTYKTNVAIFCLSLAFSLYGGEILLSSTLAQLVGVVSDTRSVLEVTTDLRKKGVDAVPTIGPGDLLKKEEDGTLRSVISINDAEVLPLGGIANKITVLCNETGNHVLYQSDEHGFHNPMGIWKSDRIDIAAVGDSFTHGWCVPSDNNFVAVLRKHYPATVNIGMGGSGPLRELAAVKEFLPRLKPKIVLWFYFEANDLSDLEIEKNSPLLMRYLHSDFDQGLIARQGDIDLALLAYIRKRSEAQRALRESKGGADKLLQMVRLSALRTKLGLIHGRPIFAPAETERTTVNLFRHVLSQAKSLVDGWGGSLYFVYLPQWERYGNPELVNKERGPVLSAVKNLGIAVIDIHSAFQVQRDPLSLFPFRRFGHYNEEGYRLVAEEILKSLSLNHKWRPGSQASGLVG